MKALEPVEDLRAKRGQRDSLWVILLLVVMGTLNGATSDQALSYLDNELTLPFSPVLTEMADVTLMDLRMPEVTGVEAIAAIRREFAHARIIVLTTYDGDKDIYRALQAGAKGYLLKGTQSSQQYIAASSIYSVGSTNLTD